MSPGDMIQPKHEKSLSLSRREIKAAM